MSPPVGSRVKLYFDGVESRRRDLLLSDVVLLEVGAQVEVLPEPNWGELSFEMLVLSPVEIIAGVLSPVAHQGEGIDHFGVSPEAAKDEGQC